MSRKCSRTGCAGMPNQRWPAGTSFITPDARADLRAGADLQMAGEAGLTAERGEIVEDAGAGNAALRDEHAMPADDDVVADLHEVVDLGALADDGVAVGAAIDRRAGADLDVVLDDDAADLRHLEVAARAHREAEAVLADARAGMHDDAVADQRADDGGAGADRRSRGRCARCGPITALAPITVPAPISASGPMTAPGSTMTPGSSRAEGWTCALGETPRVPKPEAGRAAEGYSLAIAIAIAR